MNVDELIKKISTEVERVKKEAHNAEGLLRLQEVAAQYNGEYRLIWAHDLQKSLKDKPKITAQATKIPTLDGFLSGGFRPQQLVTLSAHTKHGKTAFGIFLMKQLEDLCPVMIPLEQSNEEIVDQYAERGFYVPNFLSPERLAPQVTTDWIEQRTIEGIAKYNTKFVVVDHLGYISDGESRYDNEAYRITKRMQSLKSIAKRWNITILLLVHISQHDESKPPVLSDIKGSSSIAQESDTVMMLWRKNSTQKNIKIYSDNVLVSIQANRRSGGNGNVGLVFDTKTGDYKENDWVSSLEEQAQQLDGFDGI